MTEPVHILVTCRNRALLPAATLVFQTLRIGFPDAPVHVWGKPGNCCEEETAMAASLTGAELHAAPEEYEHDGWIQFLLEEEEEPFWICDTDVVFWTKFEHTPDGSPLAGVRTPSFFEPWMGVQYRERLHTCLMRIDPKAFRKAESRYLDRFPAHPFAPVLELVHQQLQPERRLGVMVTHFYDTLAMAWHCFGGQEFTKRQIESFDHLNCATYADLIAPSLDFDIRKAHNAIYEDISRARGSWALQFKWFAEHKVQA
jgi:hypothetical protein